MKTELTIEQSQRLIELGVSIDKASKEMYATISEQEYNDPPHPIFTLTDLLDILPKRIKKNDASLALTISYNDWCAAYEYYSWLSDLDTVYRVSAPELIDALYELTIFVYTNHYE